MPSKMRGQPAPETRHRFSKSCGTLIYVLQNFRLDAKKSQKTELDSDSFAFASRLGYSHDVTHCAPSQFNAKVAFACAASLAYWFGSPSCENRWDITLPRCWTAWGAGDLIPPAWRSFTILYRQRSADSACLPLKGHSTGKNFSGAFNPKFFPAGHWMPYKAMPPSLRKPTRMTSGAGSKRISPW